MDEQKDTSQQSLLDFNLDAIVAERRKKSQKKWMIGGIAAIIIICVVVGVLLAKKTAAPSREVYRGISWGMTRQEVGQLESGRGNTVKNIGENDNTVTYTIKDLVDSENATNRCVYCFDGKGGTLSSFMIGTGDKGDYLWFTLGAVIKNLYGNGEVEQNTTGEPLYANAKWKNEYETVEGIFFYSSTNNEAYFTFTQTD